MNTATKPDSLAFTIKADPGRPYVTALLRVMWGDLSSNGGTLTAVFHDGTIVLLTNKPGDIQLHGVAYNIRAEYKQTPDGTWVSASPLHMGRHPGAAPTLRARAAMQDILDRLMRMLVADHYHYVAEGIIRTREAEIDRLYAAEVEAQEKLRAIQLAIVEQTQSLNDFRARRNA